MAGPMMAYRCEVTCVLAAQMACQPTNFCLLLLSTLPTLISDRVLLLCYLVGKSWHQGYLAVGISQSIDVCATDFLEQIGSPFR